jgi:hypothetical protein
MNIKKEMLVPGACYGTKDQLPLNRGYEWINKLPNKKIYFALFQGWPAKDLPKGYDYYIVSFHLEAVNLDWIRSQEVNGKIIVLFDGNHYDLEIPGVEFVSFFYWHYQIEKMQQWFGMQPKQQPKYKFSAVCNRITQSKLWVTIKLLEVARESSLIVLNSWLEEKNVHAWQLTGLPELDKYTEIYREKYLGTEIKIDDFDTRTQNVQSITGTPWQPLYQDCAINFTNESFHYSYMAADNQEYVWPGPFITEKTLKCLLGGTAFVPVGQFHTYKTLQDLGFKFNYQFDTAWDNDSGNLTRFCKILELINWLNQFDVDQLVEFTKDANEHNQHHITSGNFFQVCERRNLESIDKIYSLVG